MTGHLSKNKVANFRKMSCIFNKSFICYREAKFAQLNTPVQVTQISLHGSDAFFSKSLRSFFESSLSEILALLFKQVWWGFAGQRIELSLLRCRHITRQLQSDKGNLSCLLLAQKPRQIAFAAELFR